MYSFINDRIIQQHGVIHIAEVKAFTRIKQDLALLAEIKQDPDLQALLSRYSQALNKVEFGKQFFMRHGQQEEIQLDFPFLQAS